MPQFSSVEEYNREAETLRRKNHNRKINAIVENSLKGLLCDCGSGDMKQKRRGTYIVVCNSCNEEYKLKIKVQIKDTLVFVKYLNNQ